MTCYEPSRIEHRSCPVCGSKDNLAVWIYDDLGVETYRCFTPECTNFKTFKQVTGMNNDADENQFDESLPEEVDYPRGSVGRDYSKRGFTSTDLLHYGVMFDRERKEIVFPYFKNGVRVAIKTRDSDKNFYWKGKGSDCLFGMNTIRENNYSRQALILTEGEFDAIAAHKMTGKPALSVPNGASGALKAVKQNLKFIESFDKVYICFDNDKAGRTAAIQVQHLLKAGKGYLVNLEYKDANEYLIARVNNPNLNANALFSNALACSKPVTLPEIPEELNDKTSMLEYFNSDNTNAFKTGIPELDDILVLRPEDVTTLASSPSAGKSSLARQIVANRALQHKKTLFFCLEESKPVTYQKLMECAVQGELNAEIKTGKHEVFHRIIENVRIPDYVNSVSKVGEIIEYAVRTLDIDFVVFDNVSMFAAGSENANSITNQLYEKFVELGKLYKHHTLVVSHVNRETEEGVIPKMSSCLNSGATERFSHNMVMCARVQGEDVLKVAVRKQRYSGEVGEFELTYDKYIKGFVGCQNIEQSYKVSVKPNKPVSKRVEVKPDVTNTETNSTEEETDEERKQDSCSTEESKDKSKSGNESEVRLEDGGAYIRTTDTGIHQSRENTEPKQTVYNGGNCTKKLQSRFKNSLRGNKGKRQGQEIHRSEGVHQNPRLENVEVFKHTTKRGVTYYSRKKLLRVTSDEVKKVQDYSDIIKRDGYRCNKRAST